MSETDQAWRANLAGLRRAGVEQGTLRGDMDVEAVAASLVALSTGLHLQMIIGPDLPDDAALSAEVERWLTGSSQAASRPALPCPDRARSAALWPFRGG